MTNTRYSSPAIGLHWAIAILVLAAWPLGWYIADLPLSPNKLQLISWHKWLGITVLMLMLPRLLWRATHTPPPLPAGMPNWQSKAAHLAHFALYALLLAVPLSGWLMSSAKGYPVVWLGIWQLPDLIGKDKELGDLFKEAHELLNDAFILLIVTHIGAAVMHRVKGDGILQRMLPACCQPRNR